MLCDRFIDSTLVYQGIGKGLGVEYLRSLHRMLNPQDWLPDVTLLLDITPEIGLKRAASRHDTETRFEDLKLEFHQQLQSGFLQLAKAEPQRFHVVNAEQSIDKIQQKILNSLNLS